MSRLREAIRQADHFLLVARLTLVLVVVNSNEQPAAFVIAVIALAGLFLQPRLLRLPWPWLALGIAVGAVQLWEWYRVDDHVAVSTYWLFALGLSRLADDPRRVAAVSARVLVACVFGLAFGWKLLSSQFVSTDFFRYQLVADERFSLVAEHVGGTPSADLVANRRAIEHAVVAEPAGSRTELAEGPRQRVVAAVFTAWGLAIEGAVALAHALPLRGRWRRLRLASLLAFSYTTYAVVPVAGFGALLMTLALAMDDTPRTRGLIVGSTAVLLVWGAVFPALV